jgi:hypothetical protein
MSFSQSTIIAVNPPEIEDGIVTFTWTSSSPPGTWFQLYIDLQLAWSGQTTTTSVTLPDGTSSFDIGTVLPGEQNTDFSASIAGINLFAELSWLGGTSESPNIAGWYVFAGTVAGGAVNFAAPVATIVAEAGVASGSYGWTSAALGGGVWNFSVVPFDTAGNKGTGTAVSVTIFAPPIEPAPFISDNLRLHYTFNPTTEEATLLWNASPSA